MKKKRFYIPLIVIMLLAAAFLIYCEQYYHADSVALEALESDASVEVTRTDYGWLFDGPSESDALIFYPGAKVEETAYAPLMHQIAKQDMDVCLVKMPLRLAIFGAGKAEDVMKKHDYTNWYIGGHSLGGAMAADFAADHASQLTGVVLLAAYPTKALDESLSAITIYGSKDGVLNMKNMEKSAGLLPENHKSYVIEGGNHAQFGNYGKQKGDGEADISGVEQQRRTEELILRNT